jgi:hypothetical protein
MAGHENEHGDWVKQYWCPERGYFHNDEDAKVPCAHCTVCMAGSVI